VLKLKQQLQRRWQTDEKSEKRRTGCLNRKTNSPHRRTRGKDTGIGRQNQTELGLLKYPNLERQWLI